VTEPGRAVRENLRVAFGSFLALLRRVRTGRISVRERSHAVSRNFFLHMHSARTHLYSLRPGFTLGLGILSLSLFLILLLTGVLLMVYYVPSVEQAYGSVKDIATVVAGGRYIRNIHRWGAHGMVAVVFFHLLRVLFTSGYTGSRRVNWFVGIALLCMTVLFSFSGYLLPWDQLAFWAVTIASNIVASTREVTDPAGITALFDPGGFVRRLLLGGDSVGQDALTRFYLLHVVVLPIATIVLIGVHFWRIRKSDGLAAPPDADDLVLKAKGITLSKELEDAKLRREHTVLSWPTVLWAEGAIVLGALAVLMLAAILVDAPLLAPADPSMPENPAKSPWYFLGVQELVSYSAFTGGLMVPLLLLVAAAAVPFVDREENGVGRWFGGQHGRAVVPLSALVALVLTTGMMWVAVGSGWQWTRNAPAAVALLLNPGSILAALYCVWSWLVLRSTMSTKMGVFALAACCLTGGIIITVLGIWFRGPNWEFGW
jgi:quinol-cytochrome oxidoreductase complex cytochrome b subunit